MSLLQHPKLRVDLRDRHDRTAFGAALHVKDQNVASAVLRREPRAIEETDSRGMTYLHQAVSESDSDNVRFLLKLGVDVNARVRDASERTPLARTRCSDTACSQGVRPVATRSQVRGSVSTTPGGVPRVWRGPSMACTAPYGGTRTSRL